MCNRYVVTTTRKNIYTGTCWLPVWQCAQYTFTPPVRFTDFSPFQLQKNKKWAADLIQGCTFSRICRNGNLSYLLWRVQRSSNGTCFANTERKSWFAPRITIIVKYRCFFCRRLHGNTQHRMCNFLHRWPLICAEKHFKATFEVVVIWKALKLAYRSS